MNPVGAGEGRIDGIDDAEAAVAVAVPVEPVSGFIWSRSAARSRPRPGPRQASSGQPCRRRRPAPRLLDRRAEQLTKRFGLGLVVSSVT